MSKVSLEQVRLYQSKNVNKENARAWVDALRSGRFRQVKFALSSKDADTGRWGHCCLGVACEVAGVAKRVVIGPDDEDNYSATGERKYDGEESVLPPSVKRWLGVGAKDPKVTVLDGNDYTGKRHTTTLAGLNDDYGFTFKQIADLIERDWL